MAALLLDTAFVALLLTLFALQQPETLVAAGILSALYATARSNSFRIDTDVLAVVLLVSLILVIGIGLGSHQGFSSIFYLFSTAATFYAARRFGSFPLNHVRLCLEIVFWMAVTGIVWGVAAHWGAPEPLAEVIPGSSTNGLPSYLIVLQVGLAISVFLEKGSLPLASAGMTVVVALLGLGRGSIVISVLVLLFSVLINVLLKPKSRGKKISGGSVAVAICLVVGAAGYLWHLGVMDSFVSKVAAWGMADPPRARMLEDYLGKLDWQSVWIGTSYTGTSIESSYDGNPHNSYIRLHSYFGLIGVLLVAVSPFAILASNKQLQSRLTVFCLVLLVLLRAVTEPILFPTALDFLYFLYFFVFWKHAPSAHRFGRATC